MTRYLTDPTRRFKDDFTPEAPSGSGWRETRYRPQSTGVPRWHSIEGLQLKQYRNGPIFQSHFNGLWYHKSPSEAKEVRGPYRNHTTAKAAYEMFLIDLINMKVEIAKEIGHEIETVRPNAQGPRKK